MTDMTIETFERLALIHGGAIVDWPVARQAQALAFAAGSAPARAALEDARVLDAALADLAAEAPPPVPGALIARILGDADRALAERRAVPDVPGAEILRPVFGRARFAGPLALAASAAIGVFMGWSAPSDLGAPLAAVSAYGGAPAAIAWQGEMFMSADLMSSDDPFAAQ
jgi:hypothetical protein